MMLTLFCFPFLNFCKNGVAHGSAAQAGAAIAHVVGGAQALVQHLAHSVLNGFGFFGHAEGVAQHHGSRQDAGSGVDDILSRDVRGRTVNGLIQAAGTLAQRGGGDHSDGAGDHGSLIRKDVAEHVLGDDDVELSRVLDDLHGAVVHEHLAVLHFRVLSLQAVHDRAPEAAGVQHIGFVHTAELLIALLGRLKADAADPLDLVLGVGHRIDGLLLAICQRLGLVLAEVHAADQLPDNEEVDALCHDLRLEGAGGRSELCRKRSAKRVRFSVESESPSPIMNWGVRPLSMYEFAPPSQHITSEEESKT